MPTYVHRSTIHNSPEWQQPKCPPTCEWIKKMWYTQTVEYYSVIKKDEVLPSVATWMNLEIIILSKSNKDKYHTTYMQNLKNKTNELIYKAETDSQTQKPN